MPNTFRPLTMEELARRASAKWTRYPRDVLPLWVAEMDFALAEGVVEGIRSHLDSQDLGYPGMTGMAGLREVVAARMASRFGVDFPVEGIDSLGSTVAGMVYACRAFSEPGDEVLLLTPLYPPFKRSVEQTGRVAVEVELVKGDGRYELDLDAVRSAVTPRTRLLMLCNPHNPLGLVYSRSELESLAELVLEHDLRVVSDELHADLSYGAKHVPFASLSGEVADRTVTLYGPTKAFNFPGLGISFALTSGEEALQGLMSDTGGLHSWPTRLAEAATMAAYTVCEDWLESALSFLAGNRDLLLQLVASRLPGVQVYAPEATYLAWLDMRATDLGELPAERLVETAKVALNEGADFGPGGSGHVRINFATRPDVLEEAIDRIAKVI